MNRLFIGAVVLAAASPAYAWKHTYNAWTNEDMPIGYSVSSSCEDTVPDDYCVTVAQQGFAAWQEAQCAEISTNYLGTVSNAGMRVDGDHKITFNDPERQILSPGVLAVTRTTPDGSLAFTIGGQRYQHIIDADIVFNENVGFTTHEQVLAGECANDINMRGVITHEIGHFFGMGHSCEDGEACDEPARKNATMFWSEDKCQVGAVDINEDDIEGFNALYGPTASFTCSHQQTGDLAVGVIPFEMKCTVVSNSLSDITKVTWSFGDGNKAEGISASNTYSTPGNFNITVEVEGEREACGEDGWSNSFRKKGFVRACDVAAPEFTIEKEDALNYNFFNETPIDAYGCIQDSLWLVYEGDSASGEPVLEFSSWEGEVEMPDAGTYTVVLNLGGPAGTTAAQLTFDATNARGDGYGGCQTVNAAGLGWAGALTLFALAARRRRS